MLLTEMNEDDVNRLNQLRIESFLRLFISSLQWCIVQINPDNTLIVYCPNAELVDELLNDLDDLRTQAYLILGVRSITLSFCQEEILHTDTCLNE